MYRRWGRGVEARRGRRFAALAYDSKTPYMRDAS